MLSRVGSKPPATSQAWSVLCIGEQAASKTELTVQVLPAEAKEPSSHAQLLSSTRGVELPGEAHNLH